MFKLDLEKAEEPEIKLPTSIGGGLVPKSCPTLCEPMDYSLPGPSAHGDSSGKSTGVGCHVLLQGIFPTQGSNPSIPHCRQILYQLSYQGSPSHLYMAQDWKRSVFIPIPKKGNAKEPSNYCTVALISQASKVMLTILQVRLQQYVN